jgi:catechol-2,3-dioxygenase
MNAPLTAAHRAIVATRVAPAKLAHLVFRTNQLKTMLDWYCKVLAAWPAHEQEHIAFITYDDEHHRVAFIAAAKYPEKLPGHTVGFYHVAFAYRSLDELLGTYVRLQDEAITPWRAINHGPTVSFYYKDPDQNDVELQVDSFPNSELTNAWMRSDAFLRNPIGIEFDPAEMIRRYEAGESATELMRRPDDAT